MKSFCLSIVMLLVLAGTGEAEVPGFRAEVLDPEVAKKACYAVSVVDVDADGKLDIVAVNESQVLWYQNPGWQRRVIIDSQTELDNVCIAPYDIDGDGLLDFALGAGWTRIGTIQWLSRGATLDEKWQVHAIGQEIWTHRMRWANVLGGARPQLVVSPLNAVDRPGVRLLAYEIPGDPRTDRWTETVLDDSLNRVHNHCHLGTGIEATVAASEEGLTFIQRDTGGGSQVQRLTAGRPAEQASDRGAGEVKPGQLNRGRAFLTTIEPMHGTDVVVYFLPEGDRLPQALPERLVIDDTLRQGHGLWTADLDRDGSDEIIVGHREPGTGMVKGPGIYIYRAHEDGKRWKKHVLDDGGVAVEDLACADLNGDGHIDIVAGGRSTLNLKVYWNLGK